MRIIRFVAVSLIGLCLAAPAWSGSEAGPPRGPDAAPWHAPRAPLYAATTKHSRYISGKDGVQLAIDYYLPQGMAAGTRLPTILQQTRYFRSVVLTEQGMASCRAVPEDFGYFTTRGYVVAIVDVRGTGASFGTRTTEMSEAEIADASAIIDWILAQPWSSGAVGTTGISYVGMLAELTKLNRHPALKASAPLYPGYDTFADLYFPGGLRNHLHSDKWAFVTAEMDKAPPGKLTSYPEVIGPCPVDGDEDGRQLARARAEHQNNSNRGNELRGVRFRDDIRMPESKWPSPALRHVELDRDDVPTVVIAGWHDSAFGDGAINRFLTTTAKQQHLILTATSHGGDYFYGPGTETVTLSGFDQKAELLRFFDARLAGRDSAVRNDPRLRWFVTGANVWRQANEWPQPKHSLRWCLGAAGALTDAGCKAAQARLTIRPADIRATADGRWHTSMGRPIVYPDHAAADAALPTFQSVPLAGDLEILGSPSLHLPLKTKGEDADVVVYLEEITSDGKAFYVTEGLLRASHARPGNLPYRSLGAQRSDRSADRQPVKDRELDLEVRLFPIAHRFRAGHSLRLVVAGSNTTVFDSVNSAQDRWSVTVGGKGGAALTLPVAGTSSE